MNTEPVVAVATPDAPRSPRRSLRRRRGRLGLWGVLLLCCLPHFWIGLSLVVAALWALVALVTQGDSGGIGIVPAAAFWNAIVGVFAWHLAISPVLTWLLMKRGDRVDATVDEIRFIRQGKRGRAAVVRFHFTHSGRRVESTMHAPFAQLGGLAYGDIVVAYCSRRRPERAAIELLSPWSVVDDDTP